MAFNITNYLDDVALYLGLYRLPGETDENFVARLKRFAKIRYGLDYKTQVNSIGEQVGAKIYPIAEVLCPIPYTIEIKFDFILIQTFPEDGSDPIFIRSFINPHENLLTKLQDLLSSQSVITLNIIDNSFKNLDNNLILRGKNFDLGKELLTGKYNRLQHGKLIKTLTQIEDSVYIQNKVDFFPDVKRLGDYFFDPEIGFVAIHLDRGTTDIGIAYTYYQERYLIMASTVTLTPIKEIIRYGLNDKFITLIPSLLENHSSGDN